MTTVILVVMVMIMLMTILHVFSISKFALSVISFMTSVSSARITSISAFHTSSSLYVYAFIFPSGGEESETKVRFLICTEMSLCVLSGGALSLEKEKTVVFTMSLLCSLIRWSFFVSEGEGVRLSFQHIERRKKR